MNEWLTERTHTTPHALALIFGERRWTYGELDAVVNGVCRRLLDTGLRPGDRLATLLPNSPLYVALVHAAARLSLVLVPLNTRLTPAELTWQIAQAGARLLLVDETLIEKVREGMPAVSEWLMVNGEWLMVNGAWSVDDAPFTINNYQALLFTSGTSGRPKMVPLTFANHFWSATASAYRLGVQPDDLWLSVLPLYHVGGLAVIFRTCLYGTAVDLHPRFNLDAINRALDRKPITLISLVPTMLHRLLQTRTHWPATLRLILLGGAAAAPDLITRANALPRTASGSQLTIQHFPPPLVAPTYGLTEAASQVATLRPEEAAHKPGSVGKALMFTRVQIVDEQGQEVPAGKYGEIVVTGPTVMVGYWKNRRDGEGAETGKQESPQFSAPLRLNSIATGDLGYLDDDGDLWLVQRRSDLIVSGGENVYPAEVEAVLRRHPAVAAACVVGVPDVEWGQRVAALVVVAGKTAVSPADLTDFCRQHLAGYKIPREVRLVSELPMTASGKIARRQVQEMMTP